MEIILGNFILTIDPWLIIVVGILVVIFIVFAVERGIKAHRLQIAAGREDLIGKTAEVKIALEPKGTVFVEGERWSAEAEAGPVESGEEVLITKVDGLKLYVTKKV
ncbi:MAG: NfeD family protein [Dehalococcoidales bacterium]